MDKKPLKSGIYVSFGSMIDITAKMVVYTPGWMSITLFIIVAPWFVLRIGRRYFEEL